MRREDKYREYVGKQFEFLNTRIDGFETLLDSFDALAKKLQVLITILDTANNPPVFKTQPAEPPNPHHIKESWWIFQTERDKSNGKVGMAYWGPFLTEEQAKMSPLWQARKTQRVVQMSNPSP